MLSRRRTNGNADNNDQTDLFAEEEVNYDGHNLSESDEEEVDKSREVADENDIDTVGHKDDIIQVSVSDARAGIVALDKVCVHSMYS